MPKGVSKKECAVPILGGFQYLVFPSFGANCAGVDYVRFVDKQGKELLYYDVEEWTESREQGVEVMGAIMAAIYAGAIIPK